MCEPATIAMIAITAASTAVTYSQQQNSAKAQVQAIQNDYANQQVQLQEQQFQTNAQSQQAMSERARQAQAERSRLRVAAGEAGLAGGVYDSLLRDSYVQEGSDLSILESNRSARMQQSKVDGQSLQSHAKSNLNQVKRPSAVAAGLQIAGSAASSYAGYQDQQARIKASKGY